MAVGEKLWEDFLRTIMRDKIEDNHRSILMEKNQHTFISLTVIMVSLSISLFLIRPAFGYIQWDPGCVACHGDFTTDPYGSPKGGTWPDSLHMVHRNASYMNSDCGLCHVRTGDNPILNVSEKTADDTIPGNGCVGCHGRDYTGTQSGRGLREHHRNTGASTCSGFSCHASPEVPLPENINPSNYGGGLTNVDDACNNPPGYREDWSGDDEGLDNDGDDVYDTADPDCGAVTMTPTVGITNTPTLTPLATNTPTARPTSSNTPTGALTNTPTSPPTDTPTSGLTNTPTTIPTGGALCDTRYPTSFEDTGGGATNEAEAFTCDDTPAIIPAGNEELRFYGFDSTWVGLISNVRVSVVYKTSASPAKDPYRFEVSLDGSFGAPITIVPDTLANEAAYTTASADLGPITYVDIRTLTVREVGTKNPGRPDAYDVEWDCAYIEIYGDCSAPSPTASTTFVATDTPTATPTASSTNTPTGSIPPIPADSRRISFILLILLAVRMIGIAFRKSTFL